jgi:hypothetical protein
MVLLYIIGCLVSSLCCYWGLGKGTNSLRREVRLKVVGRFARFYSRVLMVSSSEILGLTSSFKSKGSG